MNGAVPIVQGQQIPLLVFTQGAWRCALDISVVDRVVSMVEVTPLPKGPDRVLGVINVQGIVVPVIDARAGFGQSPRDVVPSDLLIMVHTTRRTVALVADTVVDVVSFSDLAQVDMAHILSNAGYVQGMVKLQDGLILIYNLEQFLSLNEEELLSQALGRL